MPKYTSLASLTASAPALDSPLRYYDGVEKKTSVFTKSTLLISLEEREVGFWTNSRVCLVHTENCLKSWKVNGVLARGEVRC